jgi:signal transduction histidine kinase
MFIGSINGLNVFYPDSIFQSQYLPPVVLTDFQILNQPVTIGPDSPLKMSIRYAKEIILSYNQNVFSFQFASLDFNAPEIIQYAYMMEGFDNDWIYSGTRRFVTYTNFDPGEYIFRVKATNSDGVWNEKGTQIAIVINPPFWGTWWFRAIIILVFLSIGPIIYFRRVTMLKKEKQLQVEFSKQLNHSQEEERKRIASELHDSLGQDLIVIKNLALMNKNKDDQYDEISKTAGLAIDEVRRIAYNLHPYQLDRLGLTKAISSVFSQVEGLTKITFDVKLENVDNLFHKEKEINIYRIIQECVTNIIKHSAADKARIEVQRNEDKLLIEIADNGKGFNINAVKSESKGFGLKNLDNRISFLGGEINFNSSKEFATIINIKIPVTQ